MFGLYIYGVGYLVCSLTKLSIDLHMHIDKDKSLFTDHFPSRLYIHQFIFYIHFVFAMRISVSSESDCV